MKDIIELKFVFLSGENVVKQEVRTTLWYCGTGLSALVPSSHNLS